MKNYLEIMRESASIIKDVEHSEEFWKKLPKFLEKETAESKKLEKLGEVVPEDLLCRFTI